MTGQWWVKITTSQAEILLDLADDIQRIDWPCPPGYRDVPLGSLCISDSGAAGWTVVLDPGSPRLRGDADNFASLCASLSAGRKASRLLAGRIRKRAGAQGAPSAFWPGEERTPRESKPRGLRQVAEAWRRGLSKKGSNISTDGRTIWSYRLPIGITRGSQKVAYDYRGVVSDSTSRHCGEVIRVATKTSAPPERA